MHFKTELYLGMAVALLSACTIRTDFDDHVIGAKLEAVSSLTSEQGTDQTKVAFYDSTVNMIHQFDLATTTKDRTLKPRYPGDKHYVVFDPAGNYVIDLTEKHLTIHDSAGNVQEPFRFVGTPLSASFRPSLGYLVIYDDLHSVALVELSNSGVVTRYALLGPVLSPSTSIDAGDIDGKGRLVLSLSNGEVALVDIAESLTKREWAYWNNVAPFSVGLTDISWLAPVRDQPDQILVKANGNTRVAIVDVNTQTVLASETVPVESQIIKVSKGHDPHVLVANSFSRVDLIYAKASAITKTATYSQVSNLLTSRLSLSEGTWTIIDADWGEGLPTVAWPAGPKIYNDPNAVVERRTLKKYETKNFLAVASFPLPDNAKVQVTSKNVFQLFPHKLGRAVNFSILDGVGTELSFFNYPYCK